MSDLIERWLSESRADETIEEFTERLVDEKARRQTDWPIYGLRDPSTFHVFDDWNGYANGLSGVRT